MSETFNSTVNGRIMRIWSTSLAGIGGAKFECVSPLLAWEKEHVLEWLDLIRRQIERNEVLHLEPVKAQAVE